MKNFSGFDVWIRKAQAAAAAAVPAAEVFVSSSAAGTAHELLSDKLDDPGFRQELTQASGVATSRQLREKVGRTLFDTIFTGEVRTKWDQSWGRVNGGAADGLSLSLLIEDPDLALLPWELLNDPDNGFLAATASAGVSRYLRVQEPPLMVQQKPLRILIIVESPKGNGLPPISEEEVGLLTQVLAVLPDVSFSILKNPDNEAIQTELQKEPHVIHFLGHGTSSQLALIGKDDQIRLINDQEFGALFLGRRSVRLVVLNACASSQTADGSLFSGIGPALVKAGVPAVVAMQYPTVQLETASKFSRALYRALVSGRQVDVAVNEGRNLIASDSLQTRDWSTPVLYLGTRSRRILDFQTDNQEVVENAWETVRSAAEQSGALAAVTQLSQRFKALAEQHRGLRVILETKNRLQDFRAATSRLDDLVAEAHGNPIDIKFPDAKAAWRALKENQWQQLRAFLDAHEETRNLEWYVRLVDKHAAIDTAIDRIALWDLQTQLISHKELLAYIEAHVNQELSDTIGDLISFSDQTLPLLSTP